MSPWKFFADTDIGDAMDLLVARVGDCAKSRTGGAVAVDRRSAEGDHAMIEPDHGRTPVQCALLNGLIDRSGGAARVRQFDRMDWQSLTFTGERHILRFVANERESLVRMIEALDTIEIAVPEAILADIVVSKPIIPVGRRFEVEIEALTVAE